MSFGSFAGRLVGHVLTRVRGLTVVIVASLGAFVIFASLHLPTWEKIVGYSVIGLGVVISFVKLLIGGEEGPIGIKVRDGNRRIILSNVPPWIARTILPGGLREYFRRRPLPRPVGIIEGSPVNQASAKEAPDAGLPANAETTEKPLEVPPDAAALQIVVADKVAVEDQGNVKTGGRV